MNNQKTTPSAITSLVLGILSIFCEQLQAAATPILEKKIDSSNSQIIEKQKETNNENRAISGKLKWRFNCGDVYTRPIVSNSVIYFGSFDSYFYAVNAETGQLIWKYKTQDSIFCYSPIISRGIIYFGSEDSNLYAIDAKTGKEKWRYATEGAIFSSPGANLQYVYINSADYLYSLHINNGSKNWKIVTGLRGNYNDALIVDGAEIYIKGCSDSFALNLFRQTKEREYYLFAIYDSGNLHWKYKANDYISSGLTLSEDTIYFGTEDKYVYALDKDSGQEKWKYEISDYAFYPPTISEGLVFIGNDSYLYAIDAKTGQEKWKYKSEKPIWYSPAVNKGIVYFGSIDGCLHAINIQNGKQKWQYKIMGAFTISSPSVSDGVIYFGVSFGKSDGTGEYVGEYVSGLYAVYE